MARGLLERAGMEIVETRRRLGGGELDLVAWDGATLVFVEVKARSQGGWGRAAEAVDRGKRARLTAAAEAYLASLGPPTPVCRFDVVTVQFGSGAPVMRHLPDAFRPGE